MTWGDDAIRREELSLVGGSWSGLLFENQRVGFPLSLTWTFNFEFAEIAREFGSSSASLTVDWVPLKAPSWMAMTGQRCSSPEFANPIEASFYFFDHHRFDTGSVEVIAQEEGRIYARVAVSGDLDGLGLDPLTVEGWLEFDSIRVQPETKPVSVEAAGELLAQFSSTAGLVAEDCGHNYRFRRAK